MYLHKRVGGFKYAWRGIQLAWREEANFRFHVFVACIALVLSWYFEVTKNEWIAVIISIGFVISAETLNTALEEFCDMYKKEHDPHIAKIKDLAAGAVFLASWSAITVGALIFTPHILNMLT